MKDKKALFGIAAGCGCLVVFGAAAIVAILVFAEGASDGPFSGDGTAVVVLSSEEGQGAAAAPVFVARFEALGVEATADDVSDDRIVLTLSNVSDPDGAVAAVLPPQRLAMYLVAADQGPLTGDEASAPPGVSVRRDYDQPPAFAGPTPESLAPVLALADGLADRVAAVECRRGPYAADPPCAAYLLESPPGITNADVETASVQEDSFTGHPIVLIELTPDGAARFADLTARGVQRKLAIVLDGEIVSAPIIQERITGGEVQLSMGGEAGMHPGEARGLAASLSTEPLPTRWIHEATR